MNSSSNEKTKKHNYIDEMISYDKKFIPDFTKIYQQVGESNASKIKTIKSHIIPRSLFNYLKVYDIDFGDESFWKEYFTTDSKDKEVICDLCARNNKHSKMFRVEGKPTIYKCSECGVHKNTFQFTNFQRFIWSLDTQIVYAFTTVGTGKTTGNINGLVAMGMRFSDQKMLIVTPNNKLAIDSYLEVISAIPNNLISSSDKQARLITLINGTTFSFFIANKAKKAEDFKSFNFTAALVIEGSTEIYWEPQENFNGQTLLDLVVDRVRKATSGTSMLLYSNSGDPIHKPTSINNIDVSTQPLMSIYNHNKIIIEVNPKDIEMFSRIINRVNRVYISKTAKDVDYTIKLINDVYEPPDGSVIKTGTIVIATTFDNPNYRYFSPSYITSLEQKAENEQKFNEIAYASFKSLKLSLFNNIDAHMRSTRDVLMERGIDNVNVIIAIDPGGHDPFGMAVMLYWDYGKGNVIYHIYKSFQSEMRQSFNYLTYQNEIENVKIELERYGIFKEPEIVFDSSYWNKNQEESSIINSKGESIMTSAAEIMMENTGYLLHKAIKGKGSVWNGINDLANLFNENLLTIDATNNELAISVFKIITKEKLEEGYREIKKNDHVTDAIRYLFQNEIITNLRAMQLITNMDFINKRKQNFISHPKNKNKKHSNINYKKLFRR